ncbi:conserved hypothetical protein [Cyanobium sp. PCC 7001]|uniref:sulfotransferase family 2 domain-containing protein n=1 Tax=Cyanobium sp. PCC 7001 TaxID=180281 RepID=UPI00018059A4|nr:sulfotransferase family 2 domain-containing protein [Cyanobium sp. PCC 7001]EDY37692.1 conserved hypothetical protein [Cyanobium sp. PCC 7001]
MISHDHRCIFIHIPRTAGTSIEEWLNPTPQWILAPEQKHLSSIQAKILYKDYWDYYFKFSIVRNPYTRSVSLLSSFSSFYGVGLKNNSIYFGRYKKRFGSPITLEHDLRYYNYGELLGLEPQCSRPYTPNSVYNNILTEELDRIYKFEELDSAIKDLAYVLGIKTPRPLPHRVPASKATDDLVFRNPRTIKRINKLYANDFVSFGYQKLQPV